MDRELLDLYSDYLLVTDRYATATGLSAILDGKISHDKITRFLHEEEPDSKALWRIVKTKVRETENDQGSILFDDTLSEKAHSEENDLVNWHWGHSKGRSITLFQNDGEIFSIKAIENSIVLILSGEPIHEPIAAQGPFVMNTRAELSQAIEDFNMVKFGYLEE